MVGILLGEIYSDNPWIWLYCLLKLQIPEGKSLTLSLLKCLLWSSWHQQVSPVWTWVKHQLCFSLTAKKLSASVLKCLWWALLLTVSKPLFRKLIRPGWSLWKMQRAQTSHSKVYLMLTMNISSEGNSLPPFVIWFWEDVTCEKTFRS